MSIDQQVRDAGSRLAGVRVEVPDLDALLRHRHRRRSAAMSGAIVVLLVVVAASVLVTRAPVETSPADQAILATAGRRPVSDYLIGLADESGIWPADGRSFSSADELGEAFALRVLGWPDAALVVETADPPSGTALTLVSGDRRVDLRAVDLDGGWQIVQIGVGLGIMTSYSGQAESIAVGSPPAGTVSLRAWMMVDGTEHVTDYHDPGGLAVLLTPGEASLESVSSVVVVFLDEAGHALGATGDSLAFDLSGSGEPLPTYGLALSSAPLVSDNVSFPTVADSAVWTDADRQTYLTLSVRPSAGRPGPQPSGFGPMTEDVSFNDGAGRAWFTTYTGEPVRSMRMWWTRPDGALWLLSMHWPHTADGVVHAEARDQMREWALGILDADADGYVLNVTGTERMAMDERGTIRHRVRVWEHPAGEIMLSTSADSVATGLTNALHRESVTIVVDDTKGWLAIDPQGRERATVAWQRDDLWFTLTVPAELADSIEGIVDGMERD